MPINNDEDMLNNDDISQLVVNSVSGEIKTYMVNSDNKTVSVEYMGENNKDF